jgi:type III restriction enzyme
MRQAVQLLDYAIRSKMRNYAHAFQVLLEPLDEYALQIVEKQLGPRVPARWQDQSNPFDPPLLVDMRWRRQLEKNQRYLEQNLVQRRSIQKLGTLLCCLDYAYRGRLGVDGVWRDVERQFAGTDMAALYTDLKPVNDFRNTYVAHIERSLDDAAKAWDAMRRWLRCIVRMVALAS